MTRCPFRLNSWTAMAQSPQRHICQGTWQCCHALRWFAARPPTSSEFHKKSWAATEVGETALKWSETESKVSCPRTVAAEGSDEMIFFRSIESRIVERNEKSRPTCSDANTCQSATVFSNHGSHQNNPSQHFHLCQWHTTNGSCWHQRQEAKRTPTAPASCSRCYPSLPLSCRCNNSGSGDSFAKCLK